MCVPRSAARVRVPSYSPVKIPNIIKTITKARGDELLHKEIKKCYMVLCPLCLWVSGFPRESSQLLLGPMDYDRFSSFKNSIDPIYLR